MAQVRGRVLTNMFPRREGTSAQKITQQSPLVRTWENEEAGNRGESRGANMGEWRGWQQGRKGSKTESKPGEGACPSEDPSQGKRGGPDTVSQEGGCADEPKISAGLLFCAPYEEIESLVQSQAMRERRQEN